MAPSRERHVPAATVGRLPVYLRALADLTRARQLTVSSEQLAERAGVNAAMVRKDLSHLGSYGTRGAGYDVEFLLDQVGRALGLDQDCPVVIVGIGNLGRALANYAGFASRGSRVAALVDLRPDVVGQLVGGLAVRHLDDLDDLVKTEGLAIGMIATPAIAAQEVADRLVGAGVTSVLNFAPVVLNVPDCVALRQVDLSVELQILSFYRRLAADAEGHLASSF